MDLEYYLPRLQETATQDSNKGLVPILWRMKLLQNTLKRQRNLGKAVFVLCAKIQ
jgi:hypothetical protein